MGFEGTFTLQLHCDFPDCERTGQYTGEKLHYCIVEARDAGWLVWTGNRYGKEIDKGAGFCLCPDHKGFRGENIVRDILEGENFKTVADRYHLKLGTARRIFHDYCINANKRVYNKLLKQTEKITNRHVLSPSLKLMRAHRKSFVG
jgi:hypothetical protein